MSGYRRSVRRRPRRSSNRWSVWRGTPGSKAGTCPPIRSSAMTATTARPLGGRARTDGATRASLRRPGLDRLRDRAAARSLDLILITAPDRLARNYVHQVLLLEELQGPGCEVRFLDRPMNQDPHAQRP